MISRKNAFGLSLAVCALLFGCETTQNNSAPTVDSLPANLRKNNLTNLENGRGVFLRHCSECHTLPVVATYSTARWRSIVGVMAPRAHLNPADRAAVEAYLVAARLSLPD